MDDSTKESSGAPTASAQGHDRPRRAGLSASDRRKKNALQFGVLIVAVALVVLASVFFQRWWNNRPAPDPQEVDITAEVGDKGTAIRPYIVCEIGTSCPEDGEVPEVDVQGQENLTLKLPKNVFDHDWTLLSIYDDPGRNQQQKFAAYEKTSVDVPLSRADKDGKDPSKLVLVEVTTALIGLNDSGEETPYAVTWSVHVNQ